MYDSIPDNYDLFERHEAELERLHRLNKRIAAAYDAEEREDKEYELV